MFSINPWSRYYVFTAGVVAQKNWTSWRDDNERLIPYRASRSAFAFKDTLAAGIGAIQRRLGTKRLPPQSVPAVDVEFEDTLALEVGGRRSVRCAVSILLELPAALS